MSRTKRYILVALGLLVVGGAVVSARWVVTIPWFAWRTAAINSYSVFPATTVRLELRTALQKNDYKTALSLLRRQKRVAEAIGFTNYMKHDLVENTGMAMRQASLVGKSAFFASWLAEMKEIAPREYRLLPMVAESLSHSDPEAARVSAEEALAILPIDKAPYRALIKSSLAHDPSRLRNICRRYGKAQLGSFNAWYFQHKGSFDQDLRTIIFSAVSKQGEMLYGISHGLELGAVQTAEFNVEQTAPLPRFNIILPTIPGVKLTILDVRFESTSVSKTYKPEQLYLTPTNGFVLSVNEVILTSEFGDNIAIQAKNGPFPKFRRLTLTYKIEKLGISNDPECLMNKVQ